MVRDKLLLWQILDSTKITAILVLEFFPVTMSSAMVPPPTNIPATALTLLAPSLETGLKADIQVLQPRQNYTSKPWKTTIPETSNLHRSITFSILHILQERTRTRTLGVHRLKATKGNTLLKAKMLTIVQTTTTDITTVEMDSPFFLQQVTTVRILAL